MHFRIGCSGWYYPEWQGHFYPSSLKKNQWFQHYVKYFDTVELNSPFYHFPQPATVRGWYRQAPAGFRYSLKVNKVITHLHQFKDVKALIHDFYECGKILEDKMGCFLFQLPPSYHYSQEHLERILTHIDPNFNNVVEFRHNSWWRAEIYEALKTKGITFCSINHPNLPQNLVKTASRIYLRFHGYKHIYADNYSQAELQCYAEGITESDTKNIWVYFNNTANSYAPFNAQLFKKIVSDSYFQKGI